LQISQEYIVLVVDEFDSQTAENLVQTKGRLFRQLQYSGLLRSGATITLGLIIKFLDTFCDTTWKKVIFPVGLVSERTCGEATARIVEQFVASTFHLSHTFISILVRNTSCDATFVTALTGKNYVHFIFSQELSEVYDTITLPLLQRGFLNTSVDWQVIQDNSFYLNKFSTSCKSAIPFVPLVAARPYHKPKELYIAMDDMLWITLCAAISVGVFGILIYQHVKRQQRKRMEILTEMMLQPKLYKTARECPKVARLPWEIKSDHVHIDMEFLLGEGTISNVYLGKLKGKSPILQWIARVEMKQYQDCPVAVRVPRHFDEPEEDQLLREISSMRRLRHHDHIALFLGWTNKNDLVCSLLELTHMNLLKYLGQISETFGIGIQPC
uniref:Protein kinase domain-containing protein n=1 Tax=Angiostrongylus cantonensis TaxID=6313 RepID=A0A0K0D443_ANGCA